jgi:HEAT repeat protein
LFPLFGAGGILGLAIGGFVTKPLVDWIQTDNLLLVWGAALALVYYLARLLVGQVKPRGHRHGRDHLIESFKQGFQYIRKTPLMQWMALAAVLFAILYYSVVFPFAQSASAQFPNENELAGFLGLFQGFSTGTAILISLLLANRLFARFGVMSTILVYPILYLIGFSALAVSAVFPVLLVFRYFQISWAEGVAQGANQAMFNIVPTEKREQTRAFIRGVANQFGVSLSGILLLVADRGLSASAIYWIGIITAALTIYFVWNAKNAYGQAVVAALRAGQPQIFFSEERPFGGFRQDAAAVSAVRKGIQSADVMVRRVSAEILSNLALPEMGEALVSGLQDDDPQVRARLMKAIARSEVTSALLEVVTHLNDPDPNVRAEAVRTIVALAEYPQGIIHHLKPLLDDDDPKVSCAAAAGILQLQSHPEAERTLIRMARSEDLISRKYALQSLQKWNSQQSYDLAAEALEDPHPTIRKEAARVIARIDSSRCLQPLIAKLGDEDQAVREAVAETLGEIGKPALPMTLEALSNPATENGALIALEHLPAHLARDEITTYANEQCERALHYFRYSLAEGLEDNAGKLSLLSDALKDKSYRHAKHALRAVGALVDPGAFSLAIENLTSSDPELRANALETLESVGNPEIVRPLLGLWEAEEEMDPPPADWLVDLLQDPDPWIRSCAALAASALNTNSDLTQVLERLARKDPDPIVRESAAYSLNGDTPVETLATISVMERIIFLRQVPLFADLPPRDLQQIAQIAEEFYYEPGEVLARQGEQGDEMYIIVYGKVQVLKENEEGEEIEIARRTKGEYVGEMAIISQSPRMATLSAIDEVRTLCISQKEFQGILRMRPETSLAVIEILCERLRESSPGFHEM